MGTDNTKPLPQEVQGQTNPGQPAREIAPVEQTNAALRMLDENRDTNNSSTGDSQKNSLPGSENTALKPNDGSDNSTPAIEAVGEMLREVENTLRSAPKLARLAAEGISSSLAEFGNLHIFGDDSGSGSGVESLVSNAKLENNENETTGTPKETDSPASSSLSEFGNWVADGFSKNVVEPVSHAISDVTDVFDSSSDWLLGLNNVSNKEFNQKQKDTVGNFNFDLAGAKDQSGEGLKLPKDAVETGKVDIGGNEVSVMRTPEGDTFLKHGDKVIAHQKPGGDGAYELALKDGSSLDFKLSEGNDGKYKLDHLERMKDGKPQQKFADGVFYNYNYDNQGNKTTVDAAGDLKGPLSPEKLEAIKKELGESGAATLRVTNADQSVERLLMQVHDKDTSSLTNIDAKTAQVFHKGQEYRLNEKDQLGVVDGDGKWKAPEKDDSVAESMEKLEDLAKRLGKRAGGNSDDAIDGVQLQVNPNGTANITRKDPETGTLLTTTEVPADTTKPIAVTNSEGERAEIRDGNIGMADIEEQQLFAFDKDKGLQTDDFLVDSNGLLDRDTGAHIDPDGNALDSDGTMLDADDNNTFGDDTETHEASAKVAHVAIAETKRQIVQVSNTAADLGKASINLSLSKDPEVTSAAKQIAYNALGMATSELGQPGGFQIPVYNAMTTAQTALNLAGIADATRLSEFKNIGGPSSAFSPFEFARDKLKVA